MTDKVGEQESYTVVKAAITSVFKAADKVGMDLDSCGVCLALLEIFTLLVEDPTKFLEEYLKWRDTQKT